MSVAETSVADRITQCQNLVRSLAWKIRRNLPDHVDIDDLIGFGQVGLVEAANSFDPERGGQFTTFAYYRVRGAIYDGLAKMSWTSRAHYRRLRYEQLAAEALELEAQSDPPETGDTLADDARWLTRLTRSLAVIYLATEGEDGPGADLADETTPAPGESVANQEMCQRLHSLLEALPDEAGKLIRAVYFEGLTLTEAGKRLGVSKAWASRLHAKTLDRLAGSLRLLGLDR